MHQIGLEREICQLWLVETLWRPHRILFITAFLFCLWILSEEGDMSDDCRTLAKRGIRVINNGVGECFRVPSDYRVLIFVFVDLSYRRSATRTPLAVSHLLLGA